MEALWFWLVSVMVAIYAVMDGFDFGAGILHPFVARTDSERRQVLGAIGPWWDGNEVWLLAGSGCLFLAFPKVLAAGFSGFYLALFMVVWTFTMRAVSIEFRSHLPDGMWRAFWDRGFTVASVLLPVLLGAALGNVVRGVPIDATGFFNIPLFTDFSTSNPVGILDWYTVLMGVFVLVTIANHGALFLTWKTEGPVHDRARKLALPLSVLTAVLGGVATLATAKVNPDIYANLPHTPPAWVGMLVFLAGLGLRLPGNAQIQHRSRVEPDRVQRRHQQRGPPRRHQVVGLRLPHRRHLFRDPFPPPPRQGQGAISRQRRVLDLYVPVARQRGWRGESVSQIRRTSNDCQSDWLTGSSKRELVEVASNHDGQGSMHRRRRLERDRDEVAEALDRHREGRRGSKLAVGVDGHQSVTEIGGRFLRPAPGVLVNNRHRQRADHG
jgi:cytochrome d ubiquinol oxidase subunit II